MLKEEDGGGKRECVILSGKEFDWWGKELI